MVYQEQVNANKLETWQGILLGRADLVRRAMGKKKLDVGKRKRKFYTWASR